MTGQSRSAHGVASVSNNATMPEGESEREIDRATNTAHCPRKVTRRTRPVTGHIASARAKLRK